MKALGNKKLLGLALGESSLLVAEVYGGEKPQVKKLAEMPYPEGITLAQPVELGKALGHFLKEQDFQSRSAVIGVPVKWIVVKPKEVPPADAKTLAPMLRLQAEAEFSSELKDLVYDFVSAPGQEGAATHSVLLIATQRKYVAVVEELCDAARIRPVAMLPSALALGEATGSEPNKNVMVLSVGLVGSELTVQQGGAAGSIRHLRSGSTQPGLVSELRRAVSMIPGSAGGREIIMWSGAGMDAQSLGQQLGVSIRSPELQELGVDTSEAGRNGDGARYASAVSLAMMPMLDAGTPMDFLHSRLAPPKEQKIPKWALAAGLGGVLFIVCFIGGWMDLNSKQNELASLNQKLTDITPDYQKAQKFEEVVRFARGWQGGTPRYLECLRQLTLAAPNDGQTYLTNFELREVPRISTMANPANKPKTTDVHPLAGSLDGRTTTNQNVLDLADALRNNPAFDDVKTGTTTLNRRTGEVTFSISFTWTPGKNSK